MTKNASDLTQIFIIPTTVSSGMSRLMSASCTDHIYTNGTIMDLVSVMNKDIANCTFELLSYY